MRVEHYSTCNPNYPEKPLGDLPQEIKTIDLGGGTRILYCVDCGAFVEEKTDEAQQTTTSRQ